MKLYAVDLQEKKETKSQAVVMPETSHTLGTWYMNESLPYMRCVKGLHNVPLLAKWRPRGTWADGLQEPSPVSPRKIQLVTLYLGPDGLHSKFNLHLLQPPPGSSKACIFIAGKD